MSAKSDTSVLKRCFYQSSKLSGVKTSSSVIWFNCFFMCAFLSLSLKSSNGAPVASITEISEVQQKVVKDKGVAEVEVSEHRVFLLGENRWEDSSRLTGGNKKTMTNSTSGNATNKCLSCRGEGHLLCMGTSSTSVFFYKILIIHV